MSCEHLEKAVECIKVLLDKNRCGLCDNINGDRVRYQCGHSHCYDCALKANHCLLCLTPPKANQQTTTVDDPASLRAKNAFNLLNSFQECFTVDVYKRSRLSEQLKLEKEIFPECIQAPAKYYNKRRSLINNKENCGPRHFPGEHITPKAIKMENSVNYIHRWLENNEKSTPQKLPRRRPFAELNVNSPIKTSITKRADLILEKAKEHNENFAKTKKQSFKSTLSIVDNQSALDKFWKPALKNEEFHKLKKDFSYPENTKLNKKSEKIESEAVVIDDEPIVIDDTQSSGIDKDKLAYLAVLEANERDPYISQPQNFECSIKYTQDVEKSNLAERSQELVSNIVPFYKRSHLAESFKLFTNSDSFVRNKTDIKTEQKFKDVSITVESSSFITMINVTTLQHPPNLCKQSVPIQTDISSMAQTQTDTYINKDIFKNTTGQKESHQVNVKPVYEKFSEDLFTTEGKNGEINKPKFPKQSTPNRSSQVVIADSDSDDPANESSILEITAEVHEPGNQLQHEILGELQEKEVQHRNKRCCRGRTPHSSDSSDKENFDPNKPKRLKLGKKTEKKKKYEECDFDSIDYLSDEQGSELGE